MGPDEKAEILRRITREFSLALRGERPIFCVRCGRPLRARETTQFSDKSRTIVPYRHSVPTTRRVCLGSFEHAVLSVGKRND